MNTTLKIGVLLMTGLTLGLCAKKRQKCDCCHCCQCDGQRDAVEKALDTSQSNVPPLEGEQAAKRASVKVGLSKTQKQKQPDLEKWGTRQGVIDVSENLDKSKVLKRLARVHTGRLKLLGKPGHLKTRDPYLKDLQRFGTRQGVIDVSNNEAAEKKKKEVLKGFAKQGSKLTSQYLNAKREDHQRRNKKVDKAGSYSSLLKDYDVTQVTIRNVSDEPQPVSLWQANRTVSFTIDPSNVEDHEVSNEVILQNVVHPQGVAFNPVNGYIYVANQLTNNVSVLSTSGELIQLIQLEPSGFPGFNSPVDVSVNTNAESPAYGNAYVVGSVSNTISVIGLNLEVSQVVEVGKRPLASSFNPVNDLLYVTNFVDGSLSVINTLTLDVVTFDIGDQPLGIGINTLNGDVYVSISGEDRISVLTKDPITLPLDNSPVIADILNVGVKPSNLAFHPVTNEMFVVATGSNEVIPINTTTFEKGDPVPVGPNPYAISYHPGNDFIYVGCRDNDEVSIINQNKEVIANLNLGALNNGLAVDGVTHQLFTSNTTSNSLKIIGYSSTNSNLIFDEDLEEKNRNFQHNPAIVKHVRFILNGDEQLSTLKLREGSATGSSTIRTVSFGDYRSPQNFSNVAEVSDMEGAVIDGSNGWEFTLPPNQTLTIMTYYQQFDMYDLLPEHARKSIGVEMSKGVSSRLTNPNSNYNPLK